MRVLVVMATHNEVDFIDKNLRTLLPYVDKIAVSTTNHLTGYNSTDDRDDREEFGIAIRSSFNKTESLSCIS